MKKIFIAGILSLALLMSVVPLFTNAALVTCDPASGKTCGIKEFFEMMAGVYKFLILQIAAPLAIIALIIGGIFMMISAGNPNLFSTGKKILYTAIIGLVLVLCSYLIINFIIVDILKGPKNWANPFG